MLFVDLNARERVWNIRHLLKWKSRWFLV